MGKYWPTIARTVEEIARLAKDAYKGAEDTAKASWDAMISVMHKRYDETPFGPTRKSNYKKKVTAGKLRFDPEKWEAKWVLKMKQ